MCVQCMAGASVCVGSASGMRAWLATRGWSWLTPRAKKRMTVALMVAAVVASSLLASGAAPPAQTSASSVGEPQFSRATQPVGPVQPGRRP